MATTKITSNVIADDAITSDQLGGDLTMPGHVSLADNKEIRVGTGNDLVIKHDGSHTTLTNTTGNFTLLGDAVYIGNAANNEYLAQFIANGAASLRYDNTEQLATVSGGVYVPNKIGVGTNSPAYSLTVDAADGVADNTYVAFFRNQEGTDDRNFGVRIIGGKTASDKALSIDNQRSGGGDALTFTGAGNLGIGTSSPAYETQIYSADDTVLSVVSGDSSSASLYLGDGVATRGRLTYNNNGDYLAIYTDNNERVRIDSTGRVGIGTTPAYGLLDVRQTGTGAQDRGLFVDVTPASSGSNNNAAYINVGNGNMTNTVFRIHHESPAANQKLLSLDTTGSNTEKFWVDEDGDAYLAGNLALASGKGIDFTASGAASNTSGNAHILDEYEYGSWTPTCNTGSATFVSPYYVKIGRIVHFSFQVHQFSDITTASSIDLRGLPFPCVVGQATGTVFGIYLDHEVDSVYVNTAEEIFFYELTNSGWYAARHSDINSSSAYFYVGGTYISTG